MDISEYETENANALYIIQRAQRVLDETETKMKKFKKEKQLVSKSTSHSAYITTPLPDIREYLSYLINEPEISDSVNVEKKGLQATTEVRSKAGENYLNFDKELDIKKTKKAEWENGSSIKKNFNDLDLKRHTQEQLDKSKLIRLEKIEAIYREKCEELDKKISSLEGKREKIKRDKVLLMRNNEELEERIDSARHKQQHTLNKEIPDSRIVEDLKKQIDKLIKNINKIEGENTKIMKKKEDLEANMRVCIRNSKEQLYDNIAVQRPKSKSLISHKCLYH